MQHLADTSLVLGWLRLLAETPYFSFQPLTVWESGYAGNRQFLLHFCLRTMKCQFLFSWHLKHLCHFRNILVPRGHDPFGQHQESWPKAAPNTGSPRLTDSFFKSDKSNWLKITERVLCAWSKIGSGQRSRFLVLTKRMVTSGDENASRTVLGALGLSRLTAWQHYPQEERQSIISERELPKALLLFWIDLRMFLLIGLFLNKIFNPFTVYLYCICIVKTTF